jgi:hypothetical protein
MAPSTSLNNSRVAGIVDLIDLRVEHFGEKPAAHAMRSRLSAPKCDHAGMLEQFRIGWTETVSALSRSPIGGPN